MNNLFIFRWQWDIPYPLSIKKMKNGKKFKKINSQILSISINQLCQFINIRFYFYTFWYCIYQQSNRYRHIKVQYTTARSVANLVSVFYALIQLTERIWRNRKTGKRWIIKRILSKSPTHALRSVDGVFFIIIISLSENE